MLGLCGVRGTLDTLTRLTPHFLMEEITMAAKKKAAKKKTATKKKVAKKKEQ